MRRALGAATGLLAAAVLLTDCPWGYGPAVDRSRFASAILSDDGRTTIFTYQRLVYAPAQGLRAFPDGGVPRYLEDEHWIGRVDLESGESRILVKEDNDQWASGHGGFHAQQMVGGTALLGRGGQRRDGFELEHRAYLLDAHEGTLLDLRLEQGLAEHGRAVGYHYLVRADGLLVLITPSLQEAREDRHWRREESVTPEIWLRTPDGALLRVGASHHYEGYRDGGVFYWSRGDRRHRRYDVVTGETRIVDDPRFTARDVRLGVGLSSDRRSLELQRKTETGWQREPLPVSQIPAPSQSATNPGAWSG